VSKKNTEIEVDNSETGEAKKVSRKNVAGLNLNLFVGGNTLETIRKIDPDLAIDVVKRNEDRADKITDKKTSQADRIVKIKEDEQGRKTEECKDRRQKGWACMLVGGALIFLGIYLMLQENGKDAGNASLWAGLAIFVAPFAKKTVEQILDKFPSGGS